MPTGEFVIYDGYLSVGGVDLSDHVRRMNLTYQADQHDMSDMGDTTHININGATAWSLEVEFNQEYAVGEVDATLFPLVAPNTTAAIAVRPSKTDAISTTNPEFQGTATLAEYSPLAGEWNNPLRAPARFNCNSALVRDVTP